MTSSQPNRMAFGHSSGVIVIAHEREVLVYSGDDESPLWCGSCHGEVLGVGCDSQFVYAHDQLSWYCWNTATGTLLNQREMKSPVRKMAVAGNGDCALLTDSSVVLINQQGKENSVNAISPIGVAWGNNDCSLAVGQSNGELVLFKRMDISKNFDQFDAARIKMNGPITAIAWSGAGYWFVVSEAIVWRIEREGTSKRSLITDLSSPPVLIDCSPRGELIGMSLDNSNVLVFRISPAGLAASFEYADRRVTGLAFGPEPFLGIGLDTGDGNKMDLSKPSGGVFRTDPHPGRPRNSWVLRAIILPFAPPSNPSASKAAMKADQSFPGWMGPPVGMVTGVIIGANVSRDLLSIFMTSLLGLVGGIVVWLWDRSRNRKV